MSRTMKRVPMDFAWPINKVWSGFLQPAGLTDEEIDTWQGTEPPAGEGWQMWETTSEGSPVSPVFASAGELAEYCEKVLTLFGNAKGTSDDWLRIILNGESPMLTMMEGEGVTVEIL